MCAIGAIINLNRINIDPISINLMMECVNYRGPDNSGFYKDNNIHLGHNRLSIIDLSESANQPFIWRNRYILVFNGEIYNFKYIKNLLKNEGFKFHTNSDTEVLIASYEFWGENCQEKFNGMWSFIIWDKKNKVAFASRDRFGIKPLYWTIQENNLYFASELKQLNIILKKKNPNYSEIGRFLYTGISNYSKETSFSNVFCLEPGHSLFYNKNKLEIKKWYFLENNLDKSIGCEKLINVLYDSISLRLNSDRKLGACLSGGIDSSTICTIISKMNSHRDINLIHAQPSEEDIDESYFADVCASNIGKKLIKIKPTTNDFINNLNKVAFIQDEPFASTSIFMQYFVMEKASQLGCKVMLDGQGSDEILLGYYRYLPLVILNSLKNKNFKDTSNLFKSYLFHNHQITYKEKLKYIFGNILYSLRTNIKNNRFNFLELPIEDSKNIYQEIAFNLWDYRKTQILEIYKTCLPSLLRYEDRNSMANSIEARLPFLDYRLVEACVSLNIEKKIRDGWHKYPLRESGILHNEVAWRKSKLGFNSPEKTWINFYDNEMLKTISESNLMKKIINSKKLNKKWKILNPQEKWRLFSVANWSEVMKVS